MIIYKAYLFYFSRLVRLYVCGYYMNLSLKVQLLKPLNVSLKWS